MASRRHGRKGKTAPIARRDAATSATKANSSIDSNASSVMKPDTSQKPAPKTQGGGRGSRLLTVLPIVGIVIGFAIMLYYPVSEGIDAWRRGQIAQTLDTQVSKMDDTAKDGLLEQAEAYNKHLAGITASIPAKEIKPYEEQLTQDGRDVAFGYITIPSIALTMPIYHGTSDAVLSAGVGHVENTSLPIGGSDTHSVLSAHSGMEGMRAFDDIRELREGSVFGVKVLGRLVCYRVYDIETVLPDDTSSFAIQAGRDLCTLVTCTPYGVNDHRLLVHGERCPVPADFEEQHPTVVQVVTNRRVMPATIAVAAVALVGIGIGIAKAIRRGWRDKEGNKQGSKKGNQENRDITSATATTATIKAAKTDMPGVSKSIATMSPSVPAIATTETATGTSPVRTHAARSDTPSTPRRRIVIPPQSQDNGDRTTITTRQSQRPSTSMVNITASRVPRQSQTGSTPQRGSISESGRIEGIIPDNRRDR